MLADSSSSPSPLFWVLSSLSLILPVWLDFHSSCFLSHRNLNFSLLQICSSVYVPLFCCNVILFSIKIPQAFRLLSRVFFYVWSISHKHKTPLWLSTVKQKDQWESNEALYCQRWLDSSQAFRRNYIGY